MTARPPTIRVGNTRYTGDYLRSVIESMASAALSLAPSMPENVRRAAGPRPGPDGQPGGNDGGPRSKGEAPDPTGNAVVRRIDQPIGDPVLERVTAMVVAVLRAAELVDDAKYQQSQLDQAERFPGWQLGGICVSCERRVEGGAGDPLRRGRCNSCRQAWDKDGRPDSHAWNTWRQRWAALPEPRPMWSEYRPDAALRPMGA